MKKTMITQSKRWAQTRTALCAAALLAALSLAASCAKQPAKPGETAGQGANPPAQGGTAGQQPPAGTAQGETGQPAKQPAAGVKLTQIAYSDADKQIITTTAKTSGVKTVYIPQQGTPDDKLDVVRGTGKQMTVQYVKMVIDESSEQMVPTGKVDTQKDAKLKIGTGQWMNVNGQPTLYIKLGNTFISISSAKSVSPVEIEAIAETLAPLK